MALTRLNWTELLNDFWFPAFFFLKKKMKISNFRFVQSRVWQYSDQWSARPTSLILSAIQTLLSNNSRSDGHSFGISI